MYIACGCITLPVSKDDGSRSTKDPVSFAHSVITAMEVALGACDSKPGQSFRAPDAANPIAFKVLSIDRCHVAAIPGLGCWVPLCRKYHDITSFLKGQATHSQWTFISTPRTSGRKATGSHLKYTDFRAMTRRASRNNTSVDIASSNTGISEQTWRPRPGPLIMT